MTLLAAFAALLSGSQALASWGSTAYRFFPIHKWVIHWINVRRARRDLAGYIPHMTPKEREILAYLLARNQKTFTAESDGGHAATLLSRGIVTLLVRPGQHVDAERVPMGIPDSLWEVLVRHRDDFPCTVAKGEAVRHPWRVHWQER